MLKISDDLSIYADIFVPAYVFTGAALATLLMGVFGFMILAAYVRKRFGALVFMKSTMRIILCALMVAGLAMLVNPGMLPAVPIGVVLLLAYFGLLKLTGELGREDFKIAGGLPVIGKILRMIVLT